MLVFQMFLLYLETHFISPKFSLEQDSGNPETESHKLFSSFIEVNKQKTDQNKQTKTNNNKNPTHNKKPPQQNKP